LQEGLCVSSGFPPRPQVEAIVEVVVHGNFKFEEIEFLVGREWHKQHGIVHIERHAKFDPDGQGKFEPDIPCGAILPPPFIVFPTDGMSADLEGRHPELVLIHDQINDGSGLDIIKRYERFDGKVVTVDKMERLIKPYDGIQVEGPLSKKSEVAQHRLEIDQIGYIEFKPQPEGIEELAPGQIEQRLELDDIQKVVVEKESGTGFVEDTPVTIGRNPLNIAESLGRR